MRGASSGWFILAVQGLVLLERSPLEVCSSAWIAESMNAHAVFLRRILSALVRARSRLAVRMKPFSLDLIVVRAARKTGARILTACMRRYESCQSRNSRYQSPRSVEC